jgi:hypothetical protein
MKVLPLLLTLTTLTLGAVNPAQATTLTTCGYDSGTKTECVLNDPNGDIVMTDVNGTRHFTFNRDNTGEMTWVGSDETLSTTWKISGQFLLITVDNDYTIFLPRGEY